MEDLKEKKTRCANEGCGRLAEGGTRCCASCGLEWTLFHRDARQPKPEIRGDRMSR